MATLANPLYANGVPTYSNEIGALGSVFQAMAPNPLRDLQIQGYASNARLKQLQGDVINDSRTSRNTAADLYGQGNYRGAGIELMRGADPSVLKEMGGFNEALYASGAAQGETVSPMVQATLSMGNGGNYANTQLGFNANQDRQTAEANQKNDTTRRGDDLQYNASIYGSNAQAAVGHERNRFYQTAEANTNAENTRYHNLTNAAALDKNDVDYDVGMDRNAKGLEGTQYTADQSRLAKQFDTEHDVNKTTGSGGGSAVDPAKFDNALLQSLPGSTQDDKGWLVNPSILPADLAEVRTRAAHYLQQNPRDQYGAIQRATAEVFGQAPSITPAQEPWLSSNTPEQVNTLPAGQRPPLPNLAQQFAAPQAAPAPMPMPAAAPAAAPAGGLHPDLVAAKNAVASGKSRQAVIQRLVQGGHSPQEIQAAGI
jgi:hypothetical protein